MPIAGQTPSMPSEPAVPDAVTSPPPRERLAQPERTLEGLLERLRNALRSRGEDTRALDDVRSMAQQLQRAAAHLGYPETLSALAHIDAVLQAAAAGDLPIGERLWRQIDAALGTAEASLRIESKSGPTEERTREFRLLLATERADLQAALEPIAAKRRIKLTLAVTVDDVIRTSMTERPDAVLLDAGQSGWSHWQPIAEACDLMYEKDGIARLALAHDGFEARQAAARAGAARFLTADDNPEIVLDAAQSLCGLRSLQGTRVLVFGGCPDALSGMLASLGVEVTSWNEPSRLLAVIESENPDLLLICEGNAALDPAVLCRIVRASRHGRDLPVFFVGSGESHGARLAMLEAGADDRLAAPFSRDMLEATLRSRLSMSRQTRAAAARDRLTGLLTRGAFADVARGRLAEACRSRSFLSICLLDVDHFKRVNDTYGHPVGDQVLAFLGRVLATSLRAEDLRGRWGGEEFIVAFYGEWAESAREILVRALSRFTSHPFQSEIGETFHVTASGGVASYPVDGGTFDDLVAAADRRLYAAKAAGRDRIRI